MVQVSGSCGCVFALLANYLCLSQVTKVIKIIIRMENSRKKTNLFKDFHNK